MALGRGRGVLALAIVGLLILVTFIGAAPARAAEDGDTVTEAQEIELAQRFAPVYYFEAEERVFPVNVEYYLAHCNLNQSVDGSSFVLRAAPLTAVDLSTYRDPDLGYFLDDLTGTIHDTKAMEQYERDTASLDYTIYCHVTAAGSSIVVQYWTFYVFNEGAYNDHEGDWEMTQVVVDAATLQPTLVDFSQHNYGQKADWSLVEKEGDHIRVFVARGSHANYVRYWQGLLEFARDVVGSNGKVLRPDDLKYDLVLLGEKGPANRPDSQAWIDFAGVWGSYGNVADGFMGRRGPPGPGFRESGGMWTGLPWGTARSQVTSDFLTIEIPFYYFLWIYLGIMVIPMTYVVVRAMLKIRKGSIKAPFIRVLDLRGMSFRSIGNLLALIGVVIGLVSAFFPYYMAELNADYADFQTGGWIEMVSVSGSTGIQINALDPQGGLVQVGSLAIPFGLLVIISLLTFFFALVAVSRRKAARKYSTRGLNLFLPLLITLVVVMSLGSILSSLPSSMPVQMTPDVKVITDSMASQPLGGEKTVEFPGYGFASLRWSVGIGAYLMALGGTLLIIGGIFQLLDRERPAPQALPQQYASQQPQFQQQVQGYQQHNRYDQGGQQDRP